MAASRRSLVLALTDLGRASRMQRHALALAASSPDAVVDLVGHHGGSVSDPVSAEPRVHCRRVAAIGAPGGTGRWNPVSWARHAAQGTSLARAMLSGGRPRLILARHPAPAAARHASAAVARAFGARLVIDWHDRAPLPQGDADRHGRAVLARERRWARRAHAHLASSRAMAAWLRRAYGVDAAVLYDRPPAWIARADLVVAAALWRRLARDLSLGPRRIPIAVCPTGWGPHDDFDLLLDALERAERRLVSQAADDGALPHTAPDLAVLITGRGPLRDAVEARLARRAFARLAVRTTWLEPAEYIALLGMADLGICLHQSASGLDLPAVLAECRGVGLPVYACDYAPVLSEAIESGKQGATFREAGELATALVTLAHHDFAAVPALAAARAWLAAHPAERWEPHWQDVAAPLLLGGRP